MAMKGYQDPEFFAKLAAARVSFRRVDDPMVIAGVVEPLVVVGAAGLYVDADTPLDDATRAMIRDNEAFLRIVTGGQGLAELQQARRISKEDAILLSRHLMEPDLIDFLLRPETDR